MLLGNFRSKTYSEYFSGEAALDSLYKSASRRRAKETSLEFGLLGARTTVATVVADPGHAPTYPADKRPGRSTFFPPTAGTAVHSQSSSTTRGFSGSPARHRPATLTPQQGRRLLLHVLALHLGRLGHLVFGFLAGQHPRRRRPSRRRRCPSSLARAARSPPAAASRAGAASASALRRLRPPASSAACWRRSGRPPPLTRRAAPPGKSTGSATPTKAARQGHGPAASAGSRYRCSRRPRPVNFPRAAGNAGKADAAPAAPPRRARARARLRAGTRGVRLTGWGRRPRRPQHGCAGRLQPLRSRDRPDLTAPRVLGAEGRRPSSVPG